MRTMASALRTFLGDTQPATHHGEPKGFLKVVWCCGMYMRIFQCVSGSPYRHWQAMPAESLSARRCAAAQMPRRCSVATAPVGFLSHEIPKGPSCLLRRGPGSHTPKLGSQRPRRWRPSDADARSPRPLSAAETAIAAGPFAEGVLSTARRGPCRLSGRAPSSHQVAVTAAVQADFWTAVRVHRLTVYSKTRSMPSR